MTEQRNLVCGVSENSKNGFSVSTRNPFICIQNLKKIYPTKGGEVCALQDVTFDVFRGEFITLVGPSGCGKTTLLKIISGLLGKTDGEMVFSSEEDFDPTRDVGMVFQRPVLLKWRSIVDNILLPIDILRLDRGSYYPKAMKLLELVGLKGFERNYPNELSGGMQQRAAISRALVHDPQLLLMDEPFGALDAFTREKMNLEILRIWQETRKTILFVTHGIQEAVFLADRVIVLSPRPARMIAAIEVNLPRPRTMEVKAEKEFGRLCLEIFKLLEEK
jgi:NitT/TauT family transport system ATP-binding protein